MRRREEILHDLEEHGGGNHAACGVKPIPPPAAPIDALDEDRSNPCLINAKEGTN